jgi:hypothetical protein
MVECDRVALVLATPRATADDDLARPIAGAPLLVRQLEWLRRAGVSRAIVNRVPHAPLPVELSAEALLRTGVAVTWIPSAEPLEAKDLARRAGLKGVVACAVPHATLGDVDLGEAFAALASTREEVHLVSGACRIHVQVLGEPRATATPVSRVLVREGSLRELSSEADAHAWVEALLADPATRGVAVRGTRVAPGTYRARGSRVEPGATVIGPCFLGPDTLVAKRAVVGPGAVLDAGAVVDSGARVVHARVGAGVVVGRSVSVERACALPGRLVFHAGRTAMIDDPLLLGARASAPERLGRLAAAAALSIATPALLFDPEAAALVRRLARVACGSGAWLGERDGSDPDGVVFDLAPRLAPPRASDAERAVAGALYARSRSWRTDLLLLAGVRRW